MVGFFPNPPRRGTDVLDIPSVERVFARSRPLGLKSEPQLSVGEVVAFYTLQSCKGASSASPVSGLPEPAASAGDLGVAKTSSTI
jgi:hypothetical protein